MAAEEEQVVRQNWNRDIATIENSRNTIDTSMIPISRDAASTTPIEKSSTHHDAIPILVESFELLSKLAGLDHFVFASTLSGTCRTCSSTTTGDGGFLSEEIDPDRDASVLQHRLDVLQKKWRLEDTAVPKLTQSIHRLQSNTTHLVAEADRQTLEIGALQHQLDQQVCRTEQIEEGIYKLHRQNKKLKNKLQSNRQERRSIVKNVKQYVSQVNLTKKQENDLNLKEQRIAQQLKVHEQLLRMERDFTRTSLSNDVQVLDGADEGNNRRRLSTFDPIDTFTDLDYLVGENGYGGNREGEEDDANYLASDKSDSRVAPRTRSARSFIDKGLATVRYSPISTPMDSRMGPSSREEVPERSDNESPWASMKAALTVGAEKLKPPNKVSHIYKLTFSSGSEIGLQFHEVPLENPQKKNALITEDMLEPSSAVINDTIDDPKESEKLNPESNGGLKNPVKFNLGKFRRRNISGEHPLDKGEVQNSMSAFLVCGFQGFDSQMNVRPTLGARIIAVDQISLEEDDPWTLNQFKESIQGCVSSNSSFTLSLRNHPLTKKQNIMLLKAAKIAKDAHDGKFEDREDSDENESEINVAQEPLLREPDSADSTDTNILVPLSAAGSASPRESGTLCRVPKVSDKQTSQNLLKSMTGMWKSTAEALKRNP